MCLLNMFLFKQGLNTRKSTKTFSRICYTELSVQNDDTLTRN